MADMTPLGQLIEDVRADYYAKEGIVLSYDAIARRGGGVIGGTRISQYVTEGQQKTLPKFRSLQALALGLRVPYRIVLEKALLSSGYVLPGDSDLSDDRKIG